MLSDFLAFFIALFIEGPLKTAFCIFHHWLQLGNLEGVD